MMFAPFEIDAGSARQQCRFKQGTTCPGEPKGRKMTETEKQSATLGAKGPKLGTRRCHECGKYTTHNARTCPTFRSD
jgi:hypothetical protein